ncbi:hypothetical protein ACIP88_05275 [Streptomyces uncialis]|uniref:hypothetical protein n=1 Tax=Streptomyces uncialis TaxID=1048205 RepID=UPI003808322D
MKSSSKALIAGIVASLAAVIATTVAVGALAWLWSVWTGLAVLTAWVVTDDVRKN